MNISKINHTFQSQFTLLLIVLKSFDNSVQELRDDVKVLKNNVRVINACEESGSGFQGGNSNLDLSIGKRLREDSHEAIFVSS